MKSRFSNTCSVILATIIVASCSKGSKDNPVSIAKSEQSKITGKISWLGNKTITLEVYNGTDWTLTDVDVVLRRPDDNLKKLPNETGQDFQTRVVLGEQRRFRLQFSKSDGDKAQHLQTNLFLKPFSSGVFGGVIGDFFESIGTNSFWSWDLVSARGFRE